MLRRSFLLGGLGLLVVACSSPPLSEMIVTPAPDLGPLVAPGDPVIIPATQPYTIKSPDELIGGPQAEGRIGDVLLTNGVIRAIIAQRGYYPGVTSFGGGLIDVDWVRPGSAGHGHDQFGAMMPMLNVEWTSNAQDVLAFAEFDVDRFLRSELPVLTARDANIAAPVIVVRGLIDAYDFLDVDFIEPVAKTFGQTISYDARFDDMNDPFQAYDLRGIAPIVYTVYEMPKGANYIKITTIVQNTSEAPIAMPVGDFVSGGSALQTLIPGLGFRPPLMQQLLGDTTALIYAGPAGVDVSYGYFADPRQFTDGVGKRLPSASLTFNGVTGVLLGETFTGLFPLGSGQRATIRSSIPAQGYRAVTRYLVIGDGSAGSVFDAGLKLLDIPQRSISGRVVDARGSGVLDATVAIQNADGHTIVTWRTDGEGRFAGTLPTGGRDLPMLGTGQYQVKVEKPGYHDGAAAQAGRCTPDQLDLRSGSGVQLACVLGYSGVVQLTGPVRDAATHQPIVARMMVLGVDPTPDRQRPAVFGDPTLDETPAGIVALRYINIRGGLDATTDDSLRLEPGRYTLLFSHGMEYEIRAATIDVPTFGLVRVDPGTLRRIIPTPGWISADFHIHAQHSPDSAAPVDLRAVAASGEGLDVLHSSDHDYVFDYAPVVAGLEARGLLPAGGMGTITGNEITPIHLGHIHAFPLERDESLPAGGAVDWGHGAGNTDGTAPAVAMTMSDILHQVQAQHAGHELVLQINHISDPVMSVLALSGMVTSPVYRQIDGLPLLATLTDPLTVRLPTDGNTDAMRVWGSGPQMGAGFTAIELTVGPELSKNFLLETALPQWFNLLNAGLLYTATANSDSHTVTTPLGLPRNFIAYDQDPADGMGATWGAVDRDAYARAINQHKVTVSAGPLVQMSAVNAEGDRADIGEMIAGKQMLVRVDVTASSWAWFDTIEIYANTEPQPLDDDGIGLLSGTAGHAHTFFAPYHRPWFIYEPTASFRLRDGTLTDWHEEHGIIHATVEVPLTIPQDAWIVAVARGTPETEGFRTLFPIMTLSRAAEGEQPSLAATDNTGAALSPLAALQRDPLYAIPAWGFTNPIFVDTDGDTDGDGNPFEALYVKQGISPVKK